MSRVVIRINDFPYKRRVQLLKQWVEEHLSDLQQVQVPTGPFFADGARCVVYAGAVSFDPARDVCCFSVFWGLHGDSMTMEHTAWETPRRDIVVTPTFREWAEEHLGPSS